METAAIRPSPITCNISTTKYSIIREVSTSLLNWKTSEEDENSEWDILWTDNAVPPDKFAKMRHYQRINHFPGMYLISRKNYLAYNLGKLRKLFPEAYSFFPRTWMFPSDTGELKTQMQTTKNLYFIVKPEASCQGRGIFLTRNIEDVNPSERYVVQEYISHPFLIDDLKFDLRIYVLVTSCDPLRIFIHEEGLTRFATEAYSRPSVKNKNMVCMHLTNYAINKGNPGFINNKSYKNDNIGHKRSLKSTYDRLEEQGFDVGTLKIQIEDIIIKTLCAIQPNLSHHYHACQPEDFSKAMCFEILGFDIILDDKARPYMLEVNHSPSFNTDSPLDKNIKSKVISEALRLAWVSSKKKNNYYRKLKENVNKRAISGKIDRISREEKEKMIKELGEMRDRHEVKHVGGYKKIYPVDGSEKYDMYIQAADLSWQELTGAKNSQLVKTRTLSTNSKSANFCQNSIINTAPKNMLVKKSLNLFEPNGTSVFNRLSQPALRKTKLVASTNLPGIVYDRRPLFNPSKIISNNCGLDPTDEPERQCVQQATKISVSIVEKKKTIRDIFFNAPKGRYKTRLLNYLLKEF